MGSRRKGNLILSPLGKAVLADAERPKLTTTESQPLAVTIDPDDPLAYIKLFDVIGNAGTGLLVDPCIRYQELADVIELASIDRVLTSDRTDADGNRLKMLSRTCSALKSEVNVQTVDRSQLHDRFFIADEGTIYVLGSSLNSITSRPGVITPIVDPAAARAIHTVYKELWSESTKLEPAADIAEAAPDL